MARGKELEAWVREALAALGGQATVVEVARQIWRNHQVELQASGDLFFTWQHDIHAAAARLSEGGVLEELDLDGRAYWSLM